MYLSYAGLLSIPYKRCFLKIIIFILLIIMLGCVINLSIYNVYETNAFVDGDVIVFKIRPGSNEIIDKKEYILIDNVKYYLDIVDISPVAISKEEQEAYQLVSLKNNDFRNNSILKINIYYNKEKIYKIIKKFIF